LFAAAQELFGQQGFESTTLRDIGDRAGIDASLVARYFGSKADLYVAVVAAERVGSGDPAALVGEETPFAGIGQMVEEVLRRSDEHGPGPILQALVRSDTSEEIRDAAEARIGRRLVEPLAKAIDQDGGAQARLRSEVAVAAMLGVSLGRSLGWFDELATAPRDEVAALVVATLHRLLGEADGFGPASSE
jgi:AcrR family transcriptional regulator